MANNHINTSTARRPKYLRILRHNSDTWIGNGTIKMLKFLIICVRKLKNNSKFGVRATPYFRGNALTPKRVPKLVQKWLKFVKMVPKCPKWGPKCPPGLTYNSQQSYTSDLGDQNDPTRHPNGVKMRHSEPQWIPKVAQRALPRSRKWANSKIPSAGFCFSFPKLSF